MTVHSARDLIVSSKDREAWLAARRQYCTASDVAAMLQISEYKSREQLKLEKLGLADEQPPTEVMDLALELEPFIIAQARKKWGWNVEQHGVLTVDVECGYLAATPDAIVHSPWADAVCQVKATRIGEGFTAKKYGGEVPLHWQLQVQCELACTGLSHGCLLALHLAPLALRAYYVPRHDGVIAKIRSEATAFMKQVEEMRRAA